MLTLERQRAYAACLGHFQLLFWVNWGLCLHLMGLMAAMVHVVPLALLHMRPLQRCLLSLGLHPQLSHQTEWHAMGAPISEGLAVSGKRDPVTPLPGGAQTGGLVPERDRLLALGWPEPVVRTVQEARAPSTRATYSYWFLSGGSGVVLCPNPASPPKIQFEFHLSQ
eukprot:superscaffoldBa00001792_g12035